MTVSTKHPDRLIVKKCEAKEVMQGKIFVPNMEGEITNLYEVLSAGDKCSYQIGDKVFVKQIFVSPIEFKNETLGSVRDVEILGYLKDNV